MLDEFADKQLPDIEVLAAVRELRAQFRKVEIKKPYPGRRKEPDSIGFLMAEYGEELREGLLGPGRLGNLDQNLAMGVRDQLAKMNPPLSMKDFFDGVAKKEKVSPILQRARLFASILGVSEVEAAKFATSFHVGRIKDKLNR